jgi:hypothetical protein
VRKLERESQSEFETVAFLIQTKFIPEARKNKTLENKDYETYTPLGTEGIKFNSKCKKAEE